MRQAMLHVDNAGDALVNVLTTVDCGAELSSARHVLTAIFLLPSVVCVPLYFEFIH